MVVAYEFPVIMKSGHYYIVKVTPDPFVGKKYHDPCDKKCGPVIQREMKELSEKLRKGLKYGSSS